MNRVLVGCLMAGLLLVAAVAGADEPAPIRALMITGGCCHDYEAQKVILSEGISARARVAWTIVHEGGESKDHKVSVYQQPDWARGYDVVLHNECFGSMKDSALIDAIVKPHHEGVAGVVVHCSMHSYRESPNADAWRRFLGVTSPNHGPKAKIDVKRLVADHPVMKGFPGMWTTPNGELYNIVKVWDTATVLAEGRRHSGDQASQPCIWVNQYGKGRVFGTTIGHHNETMQDPVYLDLLTRGLLWAVQKLDDQGQPLAGYGK